jgi:lambda family phage portal protein
VQCKVGASFSAFIHDIEPPPASPTADQENGDFDLEQLSPGIVEHLPPGKNITFGTPPMTQGEAHKVYISTVLHAVASGIGITYESLTGDLSGVNFSSGRMGWIEMQRYIDSWRTNMVIPQVCKPTFKWWVESLVLTGDISERERSLISYNWTPPRREMIDPTKEIAGKIDAIKSGLETFSDVIRQSGKDPDMHMDELKKDFDKLQALGLQLDINPAAPQI